jgi:Zn ribbon nucleic-acid-binding protein
MIIPGKCPKCKEGPLHADRLDGRAFLLPRHRARELNVLHVKCHKCGHEYNKQTPLNLMRGEDT